MSSSSTKICFNPDCKDTKLERSRKGWRLRAGEFAQLCDRCVTAFEEGRFCETFHSNSAGWRSCESCGKRVHCGCIVSVHAFVLLDAGGVECVACARKNIIVASNSTWPSSLVLPLPLPDRLKDLSVRNWSQIAGPSAVVGQWRQGSNLWNTATGQSELHPRTPHEVDRSNGIEKLISSERLSVSGLETKKTEDPPDRVISGSLKLAAPDRRANVNAGIDTYPAFNTFRREEGNLDVMQFPGRLIGENDPMVARKGANAEPGSNTSVAGLNSEASASSCANISLQSSALKNDQSIPHYGTVVSDASPNETSGSTRFSGTQSQRQTPPPLSKQFYANPQNGVDSSGETQTRNGKARGEARGRNQLLPRYWPKITDQELQQISGNSNSVITPLFEKMLSASDAGRIGRLVLPKKCAEAYFPAISQPEGLPLKVQDARGKEWVFQFRFWPNNNSRMYVLEGVTPCIHSMQLQAGDTVTFSRLDPEGKLVMGFRKASGAPPSDQDNQKLKPGKAVSANGEANKKVRQNKVVSAHPLMDSAESTRDSQINQVNLADPASVWSKVDKSGYIAKEVPGAKSSLQCKRKSSTLGSKSKRLRIDNADLIELKLTWEAAQGLLRPPPNNVPSIVVIEGYEFEEYEEAPILGKPTIPSTNHAGEKIQWAQCEDCSKWRKLPINVLLPSRWTCSNNSWDPKRSLCSVAQEISTEQLENLLSATKPAVSKKTKTVKQKADAIEESEGLDTLADLAILGEGEGLHSLSQPTTKHPRHRPGCTCIVCIQPPSGKGPKHNQSCTCNVCLTVKRRFRTLMLRREKKQSEKEAETARKRQEQLLLPENAEQEDGPPMSSNTSNSSPNPKKVHNEEADDDSNGKKPSSSPFKGQIDLNIQPEREDELSPGSDPGSMMRLLRDATEMCLRQQRLSSTTGSSDPIVNHIELQDDRPKAKGGELEDGVPHVDHPVTFSMSMSASTSATG